MIGSAAAFLLLWAGQPTQLVDISNDYDTPEQRESIQLRAMDVLLIEARTGQRAVVQFTQVNDIVPRTGWRYRQAAGKDVISGVGEVVEKYERIAEGGKVRVFLYPAMTRSFAQERSGQSGSIHYLPVVLCRPSPEACEGEARRGRRLR